MKFEVLSAVTRTLRKILHTLEFIPYPQQCEMRDKKPSKILQKAGELFKPFSCSKTNSSS
jgi:hypothetical protein